MFGKNIKNHRLSMVFQQSSIGLLSLVFAPALVATELDTKVLIDSQQQLLEQQRRSNQNQQQAQLSSELTPNAKANRPQTSVDITDPNQLAQTLHLAIRRQHWSVAQQLLHHYRQHQSADPQLIHFAQGGLLRWQGQLAEAKREYQALVSSAPDFLPAKLELARLEFETHHNLDAQYWFSQVLASLPRDNPRADGVRRTIERYQQALKRREQWHGSIDIGLTTNDNINRSSASYECLLSSESGQCLFDRATPSAQTAHGPSYQASVAKRTSISGAHGIEFSALAYGNHYTSHNEYDEHTVQLTLDYSHHQPSTQLSVGPRFEMTYFDGTQLFTSTGLELSWLSQYSVTTTYKLTASASYEDYHPASLTYLSDWLLSMDASYWMQLPNQWLYFGGLEFNQKDNDEKAYGYQLIGLRQGLHKPLSSWVELSLFASLRQRHYSGHNALLEARRRDFEQHYSVIIQSPKLSYWGITPTISWSHSRTKSNVDWLYSYHQNQLSLKFSKRF